MNQLTEADQIIYDSGDFRVAVGPSGYDGNPRIKLAFKVFSAETEEDDVHDLRLHNAIELIKALVTAIGEI